MRSGVFVLAFLCILAAAKPQVHAAPAPVTPAPSAPASLAPSTDDAVMARAKEWLHRLQTGDIDRSQLDDRVNAALTADVVKSTAAQFGPLGDPQSFTFAGKQPLAGGMTAYVYRVVFKTATVNEVFVLDKTGKIAGIQFPPAK